MGDLLNSDTVDSLTLTSAGAAATATVAGSPYMITPSAAVGTGLGNYTIGYDNATIGLMVNAGAVDDHGGRTRPRPTATTIVFDETTPSTDFLRRAASSTPTRWPASR